MSRSSFPIPDEVVYPYRNSSTTSSTLYTYLDPLGAYSSRPVKTRSVSPLVTHTEPLDVLPCATMYAFLMASHFQVAVSLKAVSAFSTPSAFLYVRVSLNWMEGNAVLSSPMSSPAGSSRCFFTEMEPLGEL